MMGRFTGQITLLPLSENASSYSGELPEVVLNLSGSVVPEPCTAALIALVSAAAMTIRRRRA